MHRSTSSSAVPYDRRYRRTAQLLALDSHPEYANILVQYCLNPQMLLAVDDDLEQH